MVVLLMALWSLCAVYFTHLLSKKKMKIAAKAIVGLYSYVLVWAILIFVFDVADLGFSTIETSESILFGSSIYHSMIRFMAHLDELPPELLLAIVLNCLLLAIAAFSVIFVSGVRLTRVIYRWVRDAHFRRLSVRFHEIRIQIRKFYDSIPLIKRFCRANC